MRKYFKERHELRVNENGDSADGELQQNEPCQSARINDNDNVQENGLAFSRVRMGTARAMIISDLMNRTLES
jgi:hypothetical protein